MQPNRLGRVLGVSARVAAEKLKERAAQAGSTAGTGSRGAQSGSGSPAGVSVAAATGRAAAGVAQAIRGAAVGTQGLPAAKVSEGGRRLARGAGRFGASLWKPFAHATGVLTLEITGIFFLIFTLFFAQHAWQACRTLGWHDRHFVVYTGIGLLFAWFAATSFWRARRKQRG